MKTKRVQPRVGEPQLAWPIVRHETADGGDYDLYLADAFEWLRRAEPNSIHAVVTDPPYGLVEYRPDELEKRRQGKGGVWRIPPAMDGHVRQPVPRFTVLNVDDLAKLRDFFATLAGALSRALVPGAHVFIATQPLVSHNVYVPFLEAGFEKRGEVIRLVSTLRGGDRPKNAHDEFRDVTVMPRSCWEPWGILRKPLEGRVQDNLRKWRTGGLRRLSETQPFKDVVRSGRTPRREKAIAPHPSLKPQRFLRSVVRAALPLGEGVILDPFMGSGSTIAAAASLGLASIGVESNPEYYHMAEIAVPKLAALEIVM